MNLTYYAQGETRRNDPHLSADVPPLVLSSLVDGKRIARERLPIQNGVGGKFRRAHGPVDGPGHGET